MPTGRGIGVLLVAVGAYLGGRLVGTYELYLVALSMAALVVIALVYVLTSSRRLAVRRTLDPPTLFSGDEATLALELRNPSLLPTSPLRVREQLREVTGSDVILELPPQRPRGTHRETVTLPPARRGVHTLPPSKVTLSDPLGTRFVEPRLGNRATAGGPAPDRSSALVRALRRPPAGTGSAIAFVACAHVARIAERAPPSAGRAPQPHRLEEHRQDGGAHAPRGRGARAAATSSSRSKAARPVSWAPRPTRATSWPWPPSARWETTCCARATRSTCVRHGAHEPGRAVRGPRRGRHRTPARTRRLPARRGDAVRGVPAAALPGTDPRRRLGGRDRGARRRSAGASGRTARSRPARVAGAHRGAELPRREREPAAGTRPRAAGRPTGRPSSTLDVATKRRLLRLQAAGIVSLTLARGADLEAALAAPHHVFTGTAR